MNNNSREKDSPVAGCLYAVPLFSGYRHLTVVARDFSRAHSPFALTSHQGALLRRTAPPRGPLTGRNNKRSRRVGFQIDSRLLARVRKNARSAGKRRNARFRENSGGGYRLCSPHLTSPHFAAPRHVSFRFVSFRLALLGECYGACALTDFALHREF